MTLQTHSPYNRFPRSQKHHLYLTEALEEEFGEECFFWGNADCFEQCLQDIFGYENDIIIIQYSTYFWAFNASDIQKVKDVTKKAILLEKSHRRKPALSV